MRLQTVHVKESPVLLWSWDCLGLASQSTQPAHIPRWVGSPVLLPRSRAYWFCLHVMDVHIFFSLATRHRATVWNFVRGRAHLSLMKPERPYTLSYPLITTQHQCSWGESMWPRLGQSNIPPLDLELKLGHTKELRWGECFLEVTVTLSRFQGGWGTSSETWFPAPSVSYMSWLLLFRDGRSIHPQLIWRYDLAAVLASQPPFVSVHFLNLSLIQYPFNIYFFLKWAKLVLSN